MAVINGMVITSEMQLQARKDRQREHLQKLMRNTENLIKPGFVWTFLNSAMFPYHGWWLYVVTLKGSWWIERRENEEKFALEIMKLFPCGYLPIKENYRQWKEAFAQCYPRATRKRPDNQGMKKVRVEYDIYSRLIDVKHL